MKMVRIRMKSRYCGRAGNAGPGDVINLPDVEAQQLIDGKYAVAVEGQAEAAAVAPSETTSKRGPKPKKKTAKKKAGKKKSKKR